MDTELEEVKDILKKYGQEHLLNHYHDLDEKKREKLLKQINHIDFELVNKLYDSTKAVSYTHLDVYKRQQLHH